MNNKIASRRQQIKQRMLMSTPKTTVKPRTLRSHTAQKTKLLPETKQKMLMKHKKGNNDKEVSKKEAATKKPVKVTEPVKKEVKESVKKDEGKESTKKESKLVVKENVKKDEGKESTKKESKFVEKKVAGKSTENVKKTKDLPKQANEIAKKDNANKKKPSAVVKKSGSKLVDSAGKKEPVHKKEPVKAGEVADKKLEAKVVEQKENVELRTSQRPTRKTKEAAAIYMEILSHKLVNESRIDDDNVSIDSFPELPNVKKTEQRENELKAKARSTKTSESELSSDTKKSSKPKEKEQEVSESKVLRSSDKKKTIVQKKNENPDAKKTEEIEKSKESGEDQGKKEVVSEEGKQKKTAEKVKPENVKEEVATCDRKTRSSNQDKVLDKVVTSPAEKTKEVELKAHVNPIEGAEIKKAAKADIKETEVKKKCSEVRDSDTSFESDMSDNPLRGKKVEEKSKPVEAEVTKRQTRNSSQNIRHVEESDDSDESFRADIRIPRKKQITRSKVSKCYGSDFEDSPKSIKKSLRTTARSYKECSSSESDHSTTSEVNIQLVKMVSKNKKFTKTRSQQKGEQSFSDSDEEPLSKLTQNKNVESKENVVAVKEEINSEKKVKVEPESKASKSGSKDSKEKVVESNEKESFTKPKRECAKRPQNYLPMFSSSDEEDSYFHGFKMKTESNKPAKTPKLPENNCTHASTSLDLSCKDIGRRFGKGKVNMSTEQIEKWLKDSAMAGNSVKSENDAMLKFGEKIPTETSHSVATSIDTEKLKTLLITTIEKQDSDMEKKEISPKAVSSETGVLNKHIALSKPTIDRKLIFRNKDKAGLARNVNAFSASNESSVYAFGEEEDVMKTPFRRPTRRPSSTATSRSEDESSKYEELPKTGVYCATTASLASLCYIIHMSIEIC
jgi:protein Jumonji